MTAERGGFFRIGKLRAARGIPPALFHYSARLSTLIVPSWPMMDSAI
jgi:hypothetical protein